MLSHCLGRLSIRLVALAGPTLFVAASAAAAQANPYHGRWTVSEDRPVFTTRGRMYKTIDVAPCGKDFCGVSVSDAGACGPVLFRFLWPRKDEGTMLFGHGRWGSGRKNVQISTWEDAELPGGRSVELYLGEGHDFGERSGNMPKFHALYRPDGAARCTVR